VDSGETVHVQHL